MAVQRKTSPRILLFFAIVSIVMAFFFGTQIDTTTGIPTRETLLSTEGNVNWIQKQKYGIYFELSGSSRRYDYPSKASAVEKVENALRNARSSTVKVLFVSETHGPIGTDDKYHGVWQILVDGQPIRTYDEVSHDWQANNNIAPWLGIFFLVCSCALLWEWWKQHRRL